MKLQVKIFLERAIFIVFRQVDICEYDYSILTDMGAAIIYDPPKRKNYQGCFY